MKKRRQYEERTNHLSCTFHRSCKFSQFLARDAQESEDFLVHKILLVWTNFPEVTLLASPAFTVHFAENGIEREIVPNRILEVQQGQGVKLIVATVMFMLTFHPSGAVMKYGNSLLIIIKKTS